MITSKRECSEKGEQDEWLRQNPRYARVLTASFYLLPRVREEQRPRSPVIIHWITHPCPNFKTGLAEMLLNLDMND